ncbi:hypothetical protein FK529_09310 [Tsukamurella asaccharolytica]|uniref:Uncharacterized protein n=1 Tax=Tsukamurella asaccharolytica TaxID=2592067 RepID=A0A5C5R8F6_9ACTN|nr:hypothetical protein [Tsukamurella asaccharolytica]TWS19389.1 hypothetical protein FK529_09310 [Tsukamurella asaccharolytica]
MQGSGPRNHSRSYVGTFATHGAAAHAALSARAKACEEEAARLRVQAAQLRAQAKQYKRGAPLRNTGRPATTTTTK